jgi:CheY-like chemotaxis protein
VLRTQSGREAIRLARRTKPDAVVVDQSLAEVDGIEVCRTLHDDPTFDPATPLVLLASGPLTRAQRSAALDAGAWTVGAQPLDTDLLASELATFVRAKRALASARQDTLVDDGTGLLSPTGLEQWAAKLAAVAVRKQEPLACVVLMAVGPTPEANAELGEVAAAFIEMSRAQLRQSDVVGRTVDGRLALLAPDTDSAGVQGFVQRLRSAIETASKSLQRDRVPSDFRAGYYAIDDFAAGPPVEPAELIRRATRAVDHARSASSGDVAFSFKQLPLN